ncbi:response regulator transcription factor [Luteolibacter pohnpeiensis]|uniref:Response regulator transcription factor n=1 Tax=Luteolibacter pohnpeiensis TaxID=454153 RepID=A0A934VTD5_9BACT|nr:LytTR family DNA-binding domain-containing protein [Luteolibacter pohnpeiensis]MBK1881377.1 response regulator transcription factor [Luteolibacter pohnpeiensis]
MLEVMLVDDEPAARRGMKRLLENHADVRVIGEADCIAAALSMLEERSPDVIFLDIELPGGSGFDLLGMLPEETKVIFVTAHTQHAAAAFDVRALDYLLKPVRPQRLSVSLDRAREAKSARNLNAEHLTLSDKRMTRVVPLRKIAALMADGDLTRFLISGERSALIGGNLGSFVPRLSAASFVRINRSLVINLRAVEALETISRDAASLSLRGIEEPLMLRRTSAARVRALLSGD